MIRLILSLLFISIVNIGIGQSHLEMLKNAPIVHIEPCEKEGEFKQSICPFKDVDTVRYMHINESPVHDFKSVKKDINNAIARVFYMANMVAVEDTTDLDVVIEYKYLDGIGGTLAHAYYPSCNTTNIQKMTFDNYDIPPGENTPDSIKIFYENIKDIAVITEHEVGHLLGFQHNLRDISSMMYPYYDPDATWNADDSLGFYLNFGPTDFISIKKDEYYLITEHFNIAEFFSKCSGMNFHMLDKRLIVAAQRLRDFYGSPIMITSSYRHKSCNEAAGGVPKSRHRAGRAIDLVFVNKAAHDRFTQDVVENNYIVTVLKALNVNRIGLYNKHIHIDTRNDEYKYFDKTNTLLEDGEHELCEF